MADEPTPDPVDALNDIIKSGVKSAFTEGERVEFQSTADLIKARDDAASARRPRVMPRAFRVHMSRNIG